MQIENHQKKSRIQPSEAIIQGYVSRAGRQALDTFWYVARVGTAVGAVFSQIRLGAAVGDSSEPLQRLTNPQSYPLLNNGTFTVGGVAGLQAQLMYNTSNIDGVLSGTLRYGQPRGHQRVGTRELPDGGWQLEATQIDQGGLVAFGNNVTRLAQAQADDNILFWNYTNPVFLSASVGLRAYDDRPISDLLEVSFSGKKRYGLPGLSFEIFNVSTRWTMNIRPANFSVLNFTSDVRPAAHLPAPIAGPSMAAAPAAQASTIQCFVPQAARTMPLGLTRLLEVDGVMGELNFTQRSSARGSGPSVDADVELSSSYAWHHRLSLTRDRNSLTFTLSPTADQGFDVLGVQVLSVEATGVTSQLLALEPQGDLYPVISIDNFYPDEAPHVVLSVSSYPAVGLVSCQKDGEWTLRLEAQANSTLALSGRITEG